MFIANPIYDVVFKYLLDDNKIAKLFVSEIIGEDVETLEYRPSEHRAQLNKGAGFTVYHVDFAATIKTKGGEHKKVIIEIQKAKFSSDIMRFRKYLGLQYMDENNYLNEPDKPYGKRKALPIISIYFLGFALKNIDSPVIAVKRKYYDVVTKKEIKAKDEFIESLTHDSFVIQIPYLKRKRRTDLEILLSIFDQTKKLYDKHILEVDESEFPEKYRPIIRRLQKAHEEKDVRDVMEAEDYYLRNLEDYERDAAEKERLIAEKENLIAEKENLITEKEKLIAEKEKALAEKEKALAENEKVLAENVKALTEKDRVLSEKDKVIIEKDKIIEEKEKLIAELMKKTEN